MSTAGKLRFSCIMFGLLYGRVLQGDQVVIDVSDDRSIPWGAIRGDVFKVGSTSYNQDDVLFSTSDNSYTGKPYTVVDSGFYFSKPSIAALSMFSWTNLYTLLGQDQNNTTTGAYLAITLGQDGQVKFNYSIDPSAIWNVAQNSFTSTAPTTWANVANVLFPPPPLPRIVVSPIISFAQPPFADAQDNPEPATALMIVTGMILFWIWRRRHAKV